jgi:hypothetical protein
VEAVAHFTAARVCWVEAQKFVRNWKLEKQQFAVITTLTII